MKTRSFLGLKVTYFLILFGKLGLFQHWPIRQQWDFSSVILRHSQGFLEHVINPNAQAIRAINIYIESNIKENHFRENNRTNVWPYIYIYLVSLLTNSSAVIIEVGSTNFTVTL